MPSVPHTSWIPRSATTRALPVPKLPASREAVLDAVLHPARLPSIPALAVKVAEVANREDCLPGELGAMIATDPHFSAALLQAVNAARDGPSRAIGSVERAVLVAGLNRVRVLALGLCLPPLRPYTRYVPEALEHSLASVGGAMIARELAARLRHPNPEDDLSAALLRDIGVLLLQQTFPQAWAERMALDGDPLDDDACRREREIFGIDHADVSAEALKRWGVPEEIVEPIRHHHHPENLTGTPYFERAELLWFAGLLTRLEAVVEYPDALDRVLAIAGERFDLPVSRLAAFLDDVRPKIAQFAEMLNREIGRCPNFGALLTAATHELHRLAPTTTR